MAVTLVMSTFGSSGSSAVQFIGLGFQSTVSLGGLSSDGSVIVGTSIDTSGDVPVVKAFRWTAETGAVILEPLPGYSASEGSSVSGDGNVAVGRSTLSNERSATGWSGGVPFGIGTGEAQAASHDGTVIVGADTSDGAEAFRWTAATGMVGLGFLPGGDSSGALDVSPNGEFVVGTSYAMGVREAFLWREGGGMLGLGDLDGGEVFSFANAVTPDGSVVVGESASVLGREAFRWEDGSMTGLGRGQASGVSADGSLVVGRSARNHAFVWSVSTGMVSIEALLAHFGIDLTGWRLTVANDISDDGRYITGFGSHNGGPEVWLAEIPEVVFVVPESSTALLFAAGLIGIGLGRSVRFP